MKNILTYVWGSGTASVACAAFAFSVSSALVRPVSRDVSVFELVFVRSVLSMGLSFLANAGSPADSLFGKRENLPLLVLRGLSGALAMNVYYASIQRLLLAEAMALLFLNPAIVAVLAYAVLGERLTWKQLTGIVGSLVGMLAVVRPPLNERWGQDRAWGVVFGGMSAVLAAVAYITIRKIGKKEASLTIGALIGHLIAFTLNLSPSHPLTRSSAPRARSLSSRIFSRRCPHYEHRWAQLEPIWDAFRNSTTLPGCGLYGPDRAMLFRCAAIDQSRIPVMHCGGWCRRQLPASLLRGTVRLLFLQRTIEHDLGGGYLPDLRWGAADLDGEAG